MPLAPGHHLGPYEILAPIGKGGMGEVYKAKDTRLHHEVALKILPPEFTNDRSRRDRFETEARAVAALNHPNIVALHDIGEANGVVYTISELIDGDTLRNLQLPLKKAIETAAQIADGLAAAHAKGITHRDLKPDNVMLTRDGRAKILDFGLAQISRANTEATETAAGAVMGTAAYMSPEQVRGEQIDTRSDIFSFGALLYELLTYKKAFDAETQVESMNAILKEDPPELPASVPAPIVDLLRACLEKSKDQRFQSAKDLAIALRALNNRSTATTETLTPLKPARKNTLLWIGAAAILLAVIGGLRLSQSLDGGLEPLRITPLTFGASSKHSPAFSPDGRSVAYQQNFEGVTEIVVQTLGAPRPLVLARGADLRGPQWTADGAKVCYTSTGDLWCIGSAGGTPQCIVENTGPVSIARQTGAAYFIRTEKETAKLFVSDPLGAPAKALGHVALPKMDRINSIYIAPDATKVSISSGFAGWIAFLSPEGAPPVRLDARTVRANSVRWFTGGRDLAFVDVVNPSSGRRIVLADSKMENRRLLLADSGSIISLDLSPDGKRIAYSHGHAEWSHVEYSLAGKRLRTIGRGFGGNLSPSGDRVIHYLVNDGRIATTRTDGGELTVLSEIKARTPEFSPDGARVAAVQTNPSAIVVFPASGGRPMTVLAGADPGRVCWSPDGEWIWYSTNGNLQKVSSQGGAPVSLREGALLACSPDGSVAFTTPNAINILAPDGKTARKLAAAREFYLTASAFGDGGRVLYLLRSNGRAIAVVDTRTGAIGADIKVDVDPADNIAGIALHPDGKRMLLTTGNIRYNISIAEGIAQPETGWRSWFRHWRIPPSPPAEPEDQ